MYDICRDMNELIRMGRLLWPLYIQPLSSASALEQMYKHVVVAAQETSMEKTIPSSGHDASLTRGNSASTDALVLEYLDRKALSKFRHTIDVCFCSIMTADPQEINNNRSRVENSRVVSGKKRSLLEQMSSHARYLLLAAFLCQVNRAERDRALFSTERNGRSSQRRRSTTPEDDESTALGKTTNLFRLRSFPLERMMSIYVSLIGLHDQRMTRTMTTQEEETNQHRWQWDRFVAASLQERFGEVLYHLRSLRVIQLASSSSLDTRDGAIRLSEPRYTCHMTLDQAYSVADSLDFPLDRYML